MIKRDFKSIAKKRHQELLWSIAVGFMLLILVGISNGYLNYRLIEDGVKLKLGELKRKNIKVLEYQNLNRMIIDSLHEQGKQLVIMTGRISSNTQHMERIDAQMDRQIQLIEALREHSDYLSELLREDHVILKKTDSLINKMLLN